MYLRVHHACALLALIMSSMLFAQFEAGTVLGTVHDQTGAVVTGCKVTLENVKTGVTVQTQSDANGNYEFVNQRLGSYAFARNRPGSRRWRLTASDLPGMRASASICL